MLYIIVVLVSAWKSIWETTSTRVTSNKGIIDLILHTTCNLCLITQYSTLEIFHRTTKWHDILEMNTFLWIIEKIPLALFLCISMVLTERFVNHCQKSNTHVSKKRVKILISMNKFKTLIWQSSWYDPLLPTIR